jgi:hypothetical protein
MANLRLNAYYSDERRVRPEEKKRNRYNEDRDELSGGLQVFRTAR